MKKEISELSIDRYVITARVVHSSNDSKNEHLQQYFFEMWIIVIV